MKKTYQISFTLFVLLSVNFTQLSCKSNSEGSRDSPNSGPFSSFKKDYNSLSEGNWNIKSFQLVDGYGDKTQRMMVDTLTKVFAIENGIGLNNGIFSSFRVSGPYTVTDDIINVSATQRGSFGMINLSQQFKIVEIDDSNLILQTLDGYEMAYNTREMADISIANGSPLGFKNLIITLKR